MAYRISPDVLLDFGAALWPTYELYNKEEEVVSAALSCRETYVPAGNKLGKDFTSAYLALACFIYCQLRNVTCRIITTSVAEHHLKVLWGEIGRLLSSCRWDLTGPEGMLSVNHLEIRRSGEAAAKNPLNYLVGRVSAKGEGLAGHHADFTLLIGDESSGLDDEVYTMGQGWAGHMLWIGNPNPTQNFWKRGIEAGPSRDREVIRITGEDSPNVRAQCDDAFPGVLTYSDYLWRRANWDPVRQRVGLDAEFWQGADLLLYPPDRLDHSESLADLLEEMEGEGRLRRQVRTIGVDPGEGVADSSWSGVDEYGLVKQVSTPTPNTSEVTSTTLGLMREWRVRAEDVYFDNGGGGRQHADRLRSTGHNVNTIWFGEAVSPPIAGGVIRVGDRVLQREERDSYVNRRAQMYGQLAEIMDPTAVPPEDEASVQEEVLRAIGGLSKHPGVRTDTPQRQALLSSRRIAGYAVPSKFRELRRQMSLVPLLRDSEGRLRIPRKHRDKGKKDQGEKTMEELLGRSPDQLDSFVLAVHGMLNKPRSRRAGAVG